MKILSPFELLNIFLTLMFTKLRANLLKIVIIKKLTNQNSFMYKKNFKNVFFYLSDLKSLSKFFKYNIWCLTKKIHLV